MSQSQSQSCGRIYDLVDALQKLYDEGAHVIPGVYTVIKTKDMANILENFPDAISSDINEARIIKKRERELIQDAKVKAERIVADAENDRNRILSESSILRDIDEKAQKYRQEVLDECQEIKMKAFHEAEDVRIKAQEEAIKIKDEAQQYAQKVLAKLEGDLNQLYQIVMNGQQYLSDMRADDEYQQNMQNR